MRVVRRGVFETNSSSTHSITMCSKEEYDKWDKGELLFDSNVGKFILPSEVDEYKKEHRWCSLYSSPEDYYDDCDMETFEDEYTTKNGEVIVAFGYYGYDG